MNVDDIKANNSAINIIGGYVKLNNHGQGLCPFHEEKSPSFKVYDNGYHCFGCQASGDVVDFVMAYEALNFIDACKFLGGEITKPTGSRRKRAAPARIDVYAELKPEDPSGQVITAGERVTVWNTKRNEFTQYTPTMVHEYFNAGEFLGYVIRMDFGGGKKITPIIRYVMKPDGELCWAHSVFADPKPIYNIQNVPHDAAQVIIVEGEKTCDAANLLLGRPVITWCGGAGGAKKADWAQLDGFNNILICSDADEAGEKAAFEIAEILHGRNGNREISIIPWDNTKPKGWDLADAASEGLSKDDVFKWMKIHKVKYEPEPEPVPLIDLSEPMPEYELEPEAESEDYERPFRILGYNKNTYFYLPKGSQQVIGITPAAHTQSQLLAIAPMNYWEDNFGGSKKKVDLNAALNALINTAHTVGFFDSDVLRGRGAWIDNGRAVLHLGTSVIVDNVIMKPHQVKSKYIYEGAASLNWQQAEPASSEEAFKLVRVCKHITWEQDLSGLLLAGWCIIAPVCGMLKWRPHIWISGGASSGKSTVINDIVGRVVGDFSLQVDGKTTEAGVRQALGHDARPVIFDEAEGEDLKASERMQSILDLARVASSGGSIRKGTANGNAQVYSVRSCFCFSSINSSVHHYADETRFCKLVLKKNEAFDADEHFADLCRMLDEWITPEFSARLFSRSVKYIKVLRSNCDIFVKAGVRVLKNRRAADQLSGILAGLYLCHSTKEITVDEAIEWMQKFNWGDYTAINSAADEERLLTKLATTRQRVTTANGMRDLTIGELIDIASNRLDDFTNTGNIVTREFASKELGRIGIKVKDDEFIIANRSPALTVILLGTPWSKDWVRPLRALAGARPTESAVWFTNGLTSRGTVLPIELIREDTK